MHAYIHTYIHIRMYIHTSQVQFYIKEHGKARKAIKHVHLSNANVKFLVPKEGEASSSSSPTESAGSKEF